MHRGSGIHALQYHEVGLPVVGCMLRQGGTQLGVPWLEGGGGVPLNRDLCMHAAAREGPCHLRRDLGVHLSDVQSC